MNIKRSIELALAQKGKRKKDLSAGTGLQPGSLSNIMKSNRCSLDSLVKIAGFFDMDTDEFLALGKE